MLTIKQRQAEINTEVLANETQANFTKRKRAKSGANVPAKPNGAVVYRGPSQIDGKPIIMVATGLAKSSKNAKTGALVQTWIMREDISPIDAAHTGADSSVCGNCEHRGIIEGGANVGRSCYVTLFHAPRNIWESYHRGIYPTIPNTMISKLFQDKAIRFGSYGDPAAVPLDTIARMAYLANFWTGYTHQWKNCHPGFAQFCMASIDSPCERIGAKMLGYRTFRVRADMTNRLDNEVICPASAEKDHAAQCIDCGACAGASSKAKADIVIIAHGAKANAYKTRTIA